ncbi:hypothetical protein LL946_14290 [Knoellia locipacati]|uniref:hypothetical protein n=1 Tax=Knoellia locipacati TaxID=882824 RepID=UPI00384B173E
MRSPSQNVLRALIGGVSVGLALLTVLVGPLGSIAAAFVLIVLTPFVVIDPASRLTALLIALHGVHWLMSNSVPDGWRDWALTFLVAVGLLTIHLAAALSTALPAAAPVPRASVRRWLRRGAAVIGLSVPVWALLASQTVSRPEGDPVVTFAALAALAALGLALWLSLVEPSGQRKDR